MRVVLGVMIVCVLVGVTAIAEEPLPWGEPRVGLLPGIYPEEPLGDASCGGVSPQSTSCWTSTTLGNRPVAPGIYVSVGYSGSVTNRGSTPTGSYTYRCTFIAAPIGQECSLAQFGDVFAGQLLSIYGSATGAGVWEVRVYN